jgi:hypothetical protein
MRASPSTPKKPEPAISSPVVLLILSCFAFVLELASGGKPIFRTVMLLLQLLAIVWRLIEREHGKKKKQT